MRQILNMAWLNIMQVLRDRSELVSVLVLPVILTLIFGLAFGSGDGGEVRVAFTDDDSSRYSQQLREMLAEHEDAFTLVELPAKTAEDEVSDGKSAAWVRVPSGFGTAVASGARGHIEIVRDPSSNRTLAAAEIVQGAASRLAADALAARLALDALADARGVFEAGPLPSAPEGGATAVAGSSPPPGGEGASGQRHGGPSLDPIRAVPVGDLPAAVRGALGETFPYLDQDPDFEQVYDDADAFWEPDPPVGVASTAVTPSDVRGDATHAEGFAQYSLGFTVMFVLFIALGSAGGILEERENGTLQRLLVTPTTKRRILGGKIIGVLATASIEAAILIVLGMVAFDVPWGRDPLALLMIVGSYILCATGFAVLVSALVRTRSQMSSLGTVSAVALAMLGGAYWPIEVVSPVMRRIADFTFTGWAMFGLVDVVARNQGVAAAVTPTLVLLGFAGAFFVAGSALLKFE